MGGLDHSFIKAYGAQATVTTPATSAAPDQAAPRAARGPFSSSHLSPPTPHARFGSAQARNPEQNVAVTPASTWSVSFSTFDAPAASDLIATTTRSAVAPPVAAVATDSPTHVTQPIRQPPMEEAGPRPHVFQSTPTFQPEPLRPLLEVEQFLWPELVGDLQKRVTGPLRELAAEFSAASAGGCRVLLFVGARSGCGVTSLLLAAARQLAEHGLRVALADAKFARPDLAAYLGIAAQVGWEDVMARHSSLADALVESTRDQLTLLPLKGPVTPQETPLDLSLAAENIKQLRRSYDLVLVDGGSLEDPAIRLLLPRLGKGALEGIVTVQDVRNTSDGLGSADPATSHLIERLQIGTIENFAA
jgi:Mrp family chromosome partitioning ATPase